MAIGDQMNDLDLLEWAGLGIAMGNGRRELKQIADDITLANSEDGVAHALNKYT